MCGIPTLAQLEREHILNTLALCGSNRTHAAKVLGLSIRCLRIKLRQYEQEGFDVPPVRPRRKPQDEVENFSHKSQRL